MKAKTNIYSYKDTFSIIPRMSFSGLMWKDKYETPRCEQPPRIRASWFGRYVNIFFGCDAFWEQYIWTNVYHNGNKIKAKKAWGWVDMETKKTTWIDFTYPKWWKLFRIAGI